VAHLRDGFIVAKVGLQNVLVPSLFRHKLLILGGG